MTGEDKSASSAVFELNRDYDAQTLEVMKRVLKRNSNCVDVGAHLGAMLDPMLRCAPAGQHFAFEPLPAMHAKLVARFGRLPNVHVHNIALSDGEGETTFQHVVSNPAYSGIRKRRYDQPNEQIQEITVHTNLMDSIVPENVPIRFVKIDVEGGELGVFRGGINTIRRSRPTIVFEHGLGAADHYGTTPGQVHDLLVGQCGLRIFLMAAWLNDNDCAPLDRDEFIRQFETSTNYYFMAIA